MENRKLSGMNFLKSVTDAAIMLKTAIVQKNYPNK